MRELVGGQDELEQDPAHVRRSSGGDPLGGVEELRHVEHPVLEQVAEAAQVHQGDGVHRLDVVGEHEHADLGVRLLDGRGCPGALVGVGGRHPHVEHHQVRVRAGDRLEEVAAALGVATLAGLRPALRRVPAGLWTVLVSRVLSADGLRTPGRPGPASVEGPEPGTHGHGRHRTTRRGAVGARRRDPSRAA
jgi:hypothetical protein